MKKKCFAMLMAVAIVVMSIVGCGGSDNKKAAEPDKKTTQSNEKKEDKDSKKESQDAGEVVESSDALNVAEDTFQMADLVTKVGGADADMIALLGAKEAAASYDTKLFGADVKIVVESKDGNVASAQLTFPSVAKDSLVNAISEQLGADGTEEADKTSWSYEDRNVVFTEGDQGNVVTISK